MYVREKGKRGRVKVKEERIEVRNRGSQKRRMRKSFFVKGRKKEGERKEERTKRRQQRHTRPDEELTGGRK